MSTHGGSIDDVDRSILEAKTALLEVTQDLTERTQRWRQVFFGYLLLFLLFTM